MKKVKDPVSPTMDMEEYRTRVDANIADWTKRTEGLCEADSFAQHQLWEKWSLEAVPGLRHLGIYVFDTKYRVSWRQLNPGTIPTVGRVGDMPVTVTLMWAEVDGAIVCFWSSESMVVDHRMVEAFLDKKFPRATRGNAENFGNVLDGIRWRRRVPPPPRRPEVPLMRWSRIAPGRPWAMPLNLEDRMRELESRTRDLNARQG